MMVLIGCIIWVCIEIERRIAINEYVYQKRFKGTFELYLKSCLDFLDQQNEAQEIYKNTVLKDKSRRRRRDEEIVNKQPAYLDKIAENEDRYIQNRNKQIMEVSQFQKDVMNGKHPNFISKNSHTILIILLFI